MRFFRAILWSILAVFMSTHGYAQELNKFRQLNQQLATPNVYRTAAGTPGHQYWQQKADYQMDIILDDEHQKILGEAIITYTNNSPDPLPYLWVQLDQNRREANSISNLTRTSQMSDKMNLRSYNYYVGEQDYDGGFKIEHVLGVDNQPLSYTINNTMMRIDLSESLESGQKVSFKIKWWYNINDRAKMGGRSGMEYFADEDNYIYVMAQFFPRMAQYSDFEGWQNKQFLGRGEFTLSFGDYDVKITTPADHILGATGELQNRDKVLSASQIERLEKAKNSDVPMMIVNEKEARAAEKEHSKDSKTWHFVAKNVRDFAFASSRKFIWDAMGVKFDNRTVMAMSFYPKEGNPLWEKYSTRVVAHTLKVYSHHTFDYPYPVAISAHTNSIGMEYPMICFNGGRPEADGTYSERTKWGMIGVIIHEVGHNYFPMIVNSDERQWTWMDEGLNTFLQGVAEREWDRDNPRWSGNPREIVDYMKGDKSTISPIMTNSESIWQFHSNAYAKPATALNILRETVMGRELFDFAFKQYANTWKFKHPTPADFFRIMEDASAVDLDWFWRGWFFTTDHVDIALKDVKLYQASTLNPDVEKKIQKQQDQNTPVYIGDLRDADRKTVVESDAKMRDFYDTYDEFEVSKSDKAVYERTISTFSAEERDILKSGKYFTEITFENVGGLVMPIILKFVYEDNTSEVLRIPAEIWRLHNDKVSKVFVSDRKITQIILDPHLETADTNLSNNYYPAQVVESRFELYKRQSYDRKNPMQE